MKYTYRFSFLYFSLFCLLLLIEILIALFVHDSIIRPYIGDVLVVILIYCFIKSFVATPVLKTAIVVLFFAFTVETLQHFHIVEKLGLQHSRAANIIIGSSFEWKDMLAYVAGTTIIILIELRKKIIKSV